MDLKLSIFQYKRTFCVSLNKKTRDLSIFMRFDTNFLENDLEFNRGVTNQNECQ